MNKKKKWRVQPTELCACAGHIPQLKKSIASLCTHATQLWMAGTLNKELQSYIDNDNLGKMEDTITAHADEIADFAREIIYEMAKIEVPERKESNHERPFKDFLGTIL